MAKTLYCHDVTFAARSMRDWVAFVEPWAADSIKRALAHVIEYRKSDPLADSDDAIHLPPYAEKQVWAAIVHVKKVCQQREWELATFTPNRRKF